MLNTHPMLCRPRMWYRGQRVMQSLRWILRHGGYGINTSMFAGRVERRLSSGGSDGMRRLRLPKQPLTTSYDWSLSTSSAATTPARPASNQCCLSATYYLSSFSTILHSNQLIPLQLISQDEGFSRCSHRAAWLGLCRCPQDEAPEGASV